MDYSPARLLCPWESPGKNPTVGCHALLQGLFLTQEQNLSLLCWQADSLSPSHLGSHILCQMVLNVKEKNKASLEGIWTVGEGLQF